MVAFFVGSVFLISTAISATRNFELYSDTSDPKFYVSTSEARAMAWLRSETPPDAVILSTPSTGNTLVPLAGRRVYAGHWSETIGILEKAEAILGFYRSSDGAQRARFIREHGITHVYVGPDERSWGARPFGPEFARAFEDGRVEIYVLKEAAP